MIPEVAINLRVVCVYKYISSKVHCFEALPSNFILLMPCDHQG